MVPSLFAMSQRACINNINDIEDMGELRYEILRPILRKVENPAQLRQLEENSPHIAEDDAELWQSFIRRDIQGAEQKLKTHQPRNPSSWWKVYRKLKREEERERIAAEEALKAALNKHSTSKAANRTNIVRAVIPTGERRSTWGPSQPRDAPSGNQALKNARTAHDKLTVLKRQTAHRQAGRSVAQSVPTHQLQQMRGRVTQAPVSMVRQYAAPSAPSRPPPPVPQTHNYRSQFVPKPMTNADRALATALQQNKKEQEEKESRLRALTGAASRTSTPVQSSSSTHQVSASTSQPRKRPAYDPFLPAKRRRP